MTNRLLILPASLFLATLALTGCSHRTYYAPPPPPPVAYQGPPPPVVQLAERNGGHAGYDEGARDAYYHAGYHPRRSRTFKEAPGYDYRLGPIAPYVGTYRSAYLAAYDKGFYGR